MDQNIVSIRGLGPTMARNLAEIGVETESQLRAIGPVEAYRRLRFMMGGRISLNALYAMVAGLKGRDWRDLDAREKAALRREVEG